MPHVCVVHLVWAPLGLDPFAGFVDSYRRQEAGVDHDLVVVFNGFRADARLGTYHRLLADLAYRSLVLPRPVQDIAAYYAAARAFGHRYFCFLNSYSVLLDGGWLAKMYRHITRDGVGLVGATGSYEGWTFPPLLPFPWRRMLRALRHRCFRQVVEEVRERREQRYLRRHFAGFPNPHVRTNGFLVSRDVLTRVRCHRIRSKLEAWRFEHGKDSLTRQVLGFGLRPLVVGKDGEGYEMERWYESHTFRSGDQRNLLIADNQTRYNLAPDRYTPRELAEAAWGDRVRIEVG